MSRINTNVSSMLAQRVLNQQNNLLNTSLERLSTGLRINRGADDPAGLIASENLRAEKTAITAAIGNAERADQVLNIAEGGLNEISSLLNELEGLVGQSANDAGLSTEEKEANQLQIDSILSTIDRLAGQTNFQGEKLLDGSLGYTIDAKPTEFGTVKINSAKIPSGGTLTVNTAVAASANAEQAETHINFSGGTAGEADADMTIEITGMKGTQQLSFAAGATVANVVSAVNAFTEVTGIKAEAGATSGDSVRLFTENFGSSQSLSVTTITGPNLLGGDDAGAAATASDTGADIVATINGQSALTDGLTARLSSGGLNVEVSFTETENTVIAGGTASTPSFDITGGGATFQLSPDVGLSGQESLGIDGVTTGRLGDGINTLTTLRTGGAQNVVNGDVSSAQDAVRGAIKTVSQLRGRLGAFQSQTVGASIRSLGVALENTAAAESQIRDTDFAAETATLTRQQILVQAATSTLSLANASPQNVLALIG